MLGDYDVNPNEDNGGLSHHSRQSAEDYESTDQSDDKKRRKRALAELEPALPHISMKPAKIDEEISRSPQGEGSNELLESGLGVDMGLAGRGISQAIGANVGPIRSPTGQISYQSDVGKSVAMHIGYVPFSLTDVVQKARRKYKGRKYEEDEESHEEERKGKLKRKREKRRQGKSKKTARGGREPKSQTKRRAASAERNLNRHSKRQAFNPNQKSLPLRMLGATRAEGIPLRLRDPVAWERKKAYERNRRKQGAMPRGMSHHYDTSASGGRGGTIGGTKGTSTKMPSSPKMGTNPTSASASRRERISPDGVGDPLGTSDALPSLSKAGGGLASLNRAEVKSLLRKIEQMLNKLNRMNKAGVEHGSEAKIGNQAGKDKASAPQGMTTLDEDKEAYRMFDDTSLVQHIVSKR
tara:strand:+ start:1106 stop:2335 length:1230 start_codon:yes stop_codon:yes gene_type:complete